MKQGYLDKQQRGGVDKKKQDRPANRTIKGPARDPQKRTPNKERTK